MFNIEFMKKLFSTVKKMEQPKVEKMSSDKTSFTDKLLGSGESRIMFR